MSKGPRAAARTIGRMKRNTRPAAFPDARSCTRGFTLIELMVVVAVIAVLAAVAMPSYFDSVRKSRRADAIAEVSRVQQAQEQWRANNSNYNNADVSSAATGLRLVTGTTVATNYDIPSGYYNIALSTTLSPTTYSVTAAGKAGTSQTNDKNCQCLRVTWTGGNATYESANSTSGSCATVTWSTANARSCWRR